MLRVASRVVMALGVMAFCAVASAYTLKNGAVTAHGGGNITYCVDICWYTGETPPSVENPPTCGGEEIDMPWNPDDPLGPESQTGTPGGIPQPGANPGEICQRWCFAFVVPGEPGDEEVTFTVTLNGVPMNDGPYSGGYAP